MSLAQLPDHLLISIFGWLSLEERHRALPLVSRRCWKLVCSLQLLHTMEVCISGESDEEAMPRLRSLAHFLLLHGAGSVRQLRLDLGGCGEEDDTQIECMGLVAAATAACSGLEELGLCSRFTVTLSSWLLPHRSSLRQLWTGEETCTVVAAPLGLMTALQELGMGQLSQYVYFEEGARLPTSLTRLVLGNGGYDDAIPMPPQIGTLCNLQCLGIWHPFKDAGSYAPLTRLAQLHTLKLAGCVYVLPDCLSALTSLQSLAVEGCSVNAEQQAAMAAGLSRALLHLTQLTQLQLALRSPGPLASLTALISLRQLSWWGALDGDGAELPHGRWMQQLEGLAAHASLVARSLPALEGAGNLQQLSLYPASNVSDAQLQSVVRWAAQHAPLQQLLLGPQPLSRDLWPDVVEAARLHPSLRILPSTVDYPDFG